MILVRSWPALPTNGSPLPVFIFARRFADEHQFRLGIADAENDLRARLRRGAGISCRRAPAGAARRGARLSEVGGWDCISRMGLMRPMRPIRRDSKRSSAPWRPVIRRRLRAFSRALRGRSEGRYRSSYGCGGDAGGEKIRRDRRLEVHSGAGVQMDRIIGVVRPSGKRHAPASVELSLARGGGLRAGFCGGTH